MYINCQSNWRGVYTYHIQHINLVYTLYISSVQIECIVLSVVNLHNVNWLNMPFCTLSSLSGMADMSSVPLVSVCLTNMHILSGQWGCIE
jgi:hypothetical protein